MSLKVARRRLKGRPLLADPDKDVPEGNLEKTKCRSLLADPDKVVPEGGTEET